MKQYENESGLVSIMSNDVYEKEMNIKILQLNHADNPDCTYVFLFKVLSGMPLLIKILARLHENSLINR